jgi:P63C domain-containing protein
MATPTNPKAKGGHARAEALSPEERKDIARRAALSRWDTNIPTAEYEGEFKIGNLLIDAAVLPNGKRLITQTTFLKALGRSPQPRAGTGVLSTLDGLPSFLQADVLKPFISDELMLSTTPIFYRTKAGGRGVGYDAELLPSVAEVYLKFRDNSLDEKGEMPRRYKDIITACDILIRGLAHVGIVALVDEATGYQAVRDRLALQAILDKFLEKEFAAWAKRFPDEFYSEIFRLRGWKWASLRGRRPPLVAVLTNNVVWSRLAPGLLDELKTRNPKDEKGNRRAKHHQFLTVDIGHPALAQHLHAVTALMRVSTNWKDFQILLNQAFPKRNAQNVLFD